MKTPETTVILFITLVLMLGVEAKSYQEGYSLVFRQPGCLSFQYFGISTPEVYLYYLESTPKTHQIFYQNPTNNTKLIEICVNETNGIEKSTAYVAVVGDGKLYTVPVYYINNDLWSKSRSWVSSMGWGNIILLISLPISIIGLSWVLLRKTDETEEDSSVE